MGSESIWEAISYLQPDRIGHGTMAVEDISLIDYLAEHKLPVEICPTSNVKTKVVSSLEEHPIKLFYEKGIRVTVNTDDPKMFGNSLAGEYQQLHEKLNFKKEDICNLIFNGIKSSFLSQKKRVKLINKFVNDSNWKDN